MSIQNFRKHLPRTIGNEFVMSWLRFIYVITHFGHNSNPQELSVNSKVNRGRLGYSERDILLYNQKCTTNGLIAPGVRPRDVQVFNRKFWLETASYLEMFRWIENARMLHRASIRGKHGWRDQKCRQKARVNYFFMAPLRRPQFKLISLLWPRCP